MVRQDEGGESYTHRPFEPGDEAAIVDLHNAVWDGGRSDEWFRWKYRDNPAIEHVPVFVATHDEEVVGAVGFVAYQMASASATGIGMLGGDLVVDPAHRRQGIYTALYRDAVTRYAEGRDVPATDAPEFVFAYANESSRPGVGKLGGFDVDPRVSYLRVQRPSWYVRDRLGSTAGRVLAPLVDSGAHLVNRLRSRTASAPADVSVTRHPELPADVLASLAGRGRPGGVVPRLDRACYEWRFTGPRWQPDATYVASRDGSPIAATITRTTSDGAGASTVSLLHTVPFGQTPDRDAGIAAILDRIVADSPSAAFLRAWNPVFSDDLLRRRGFLSDDRRPLSWVRESDLTLVAFSLPDGAFDAETLRTSGPALWSLDK